MATIVSLFDFLGLAVEPWTLAGHDTVIIDIKHTDSCHRRAIYAIGMDLEDPQAENVILALQPDLILSWPPCTDLSWAGTRHFMQKLKKDPWFQDKATHLLRLAERLGNKLGIPWLIENPDGAARHIWRESDWSFDPHEYGGYLPMDDIHPLFPSVFPDRDAYSKHTHIWSSFSKPPTRPVDCIFSGLGTTDGLGGTSDRTKTIRSATPRGFAIALYKHLKEWFE